MTLFGWDASHFDGVLSQATLARARTEGITFFTHKIGEGLSNDDPTDATVLAAARDAGIEFLGGYYIPHQGLPVAAEVSRCIALADRDEPWWRNFPGWFWQCDAERWSPTDRTTPAEVKLFCDQLAQATGRLVVCYASRGQYGNELTGLGHPLWNAAYGTNPIGNFKTIYPGDNSPHWAPYSGQVPIMWQYGSRATIAGVTTCDANAYRGTVSDLRQLIEGDSMSAEAENWIHQVYNAAFFGGSSCGTTPPGAKNNSIIAKLDYIIATLQALGSGNAGSLTVQDVYEQCQKALESLEPLQFKTTSS